MNDKLKMIGNILLQPRRAVRLGAMPGRVVIMHGDGQTLVITPALARRLAELLPEYADQSETEAKREQEKGTYRV